MNDIDAGRILLPIARAAIARELGRNHPATEDAPWLHGPGACFVTLRQGERLRGCIGTLLAHRPLLEDVKANARAAAFRDPRFAPLADDELDLTAVEVSLLSPLAPLAFRDEEDALAQLRPGIDGLVFEYGYHQSTYLPQVWEDLPDAAEFLATLKQKAGLPPDFWDVEVKLARYTVSKWSEGSNIADL
jgi:AmmeMemoRadiSam system protein A